MTRSVSMKISRNPTRLETLEMFYEHALNDINLPELLYVNAVSSARVVCRDELMRLKENDDLWAGDGGDREKVLFDLYEKITNKLFDSSSSFLEKAPFIRSEIKRVTRTLEELDCTFSGISDYIQAGKISNCAPVEIRSGDILVVTTDEHHLAHRNSIRQEIESLVPGVKVLVTNTPLSFSVIRPAPEMVDEHG